MTKQELIKHVADNEFFQPSTPDKLLVCSNGMAFWPGMRQHAEGYAAEHSLGKPHVITQDDVKAYKADLSGKAEAQAEAEAKAKQEAEAKAKQEAEAEADEKPAKSTTTKKGK